MDESIVCRRSFADVYLYPLYFKVFASCFVVISRFAVSFLCSIKMWLCFVLR